MLELVEFPNCCTMKVIVGFGGTEIAGRRLRDNDTTEEDLLQEVNGLVDLARRRGNAIVLATINNEQEQARRVLAQAGFGGRSRWANKDTHPETTVRLYYKRLNP